MTELVRKTGKTTEEDRWSMECLSDERCDQRATDFKLTPVEQAIYDTIVRESNVRAREIVENDSDLHCADGQTYDLGHGTFGLSSE